jgi:hypothetical protein
MVVAILKRLTVTKSAIKHLPQRLETVVPLEAPVLWIVLVILKPVEPSKIIAVLQVLGLVLALYVLQEKAPLGSLNDLVVSVVVEPEDLAVVLVVPDVEGSLFSF